MRKEYKEGAAVWIEGEVINKNLDLKISFNGVGKIISWSNSSNKFWEAYENGNYSVYLLGCSVNYKMVNSEWEVRHHEICNNDILSIPESCLSFIE